MCCRDAVGASACRRPASAASRRGGSDLERLVAGRPLRQPDRGPEPGRRRGRAPASAATPPCSARPPVRGSRPLARDEALTGFFESLTARRLIGPAHRHPGHEHPADVRHRLAADEPTLVEQPVVVAVELLVGVVGEDGGLDLVGDGEHERVAPADGPGGRCDELVVLDGGVELGHLPRVDAMAEGGVHDDRDDVVGVLLHEGQDGLVELLEARQRSPFGGEVGAVDDDVSWHTGSSVNHLDSAGARDPLRRGGRSEASAVPCAP